MSERTAGHSRFLPLGAVLAATVVILLVWTTAARSAKPAPDESLLVRLYFDGIQELEALTSYDIWEVHHDGDAYALVALDAAELASLRAAGSRAEVDASATAQLRALASNQMFADGYRTVDELYAGLDALDDAYPNLTEVVVYGESECLAAGGCLTPGGDDLAGYELKALRITNEGIPGASVLAESGVTRGEKPVLFFMANIHAREITTPELAMRFAGWLLDGYGEDAEATWLVDWHEIWIVPTANPDGHWLVELGATPENGGTPSFHRKNANQDADGDGVADCTQWPSYSSRHYGVDLNRNHSFGWGLPGSSPLPCDPTYRGPAAASELEVADLQDLVRELIPDQRGDALDDPAPEETTGILITVHSYSELVLWPWGFRYDAAPNRSGLKAIGDKLASFNGYQSCQPTECLYAASGATDDWAYGELGIPAFTFEVGKEFMPPYAEVDAVQWPENKPAFIYAARIARTPYQLAFGPDSQAAEASVHSGLATLQVVLDDSENGGNTVAGGEFSVGLPFWDGAHTAVPLAATDGAFDSATELATAEIDVSALPDGQHLVYFRGQDSEGNWGAVTAAFLDIGPEMHWLYLPGVVGP